MLSIFLSSSKSTDNGFHSYVDYWISSLQGTNFYLTVYPWTIEIVNKATLRKEKCTLSVFNH